MAKDRVPVGTRSAAKKTEVSKTDFVSPRVEMYLPYAVIRVINLLIEMFHVCTSLLTIVVWENQNDLGQFRFPNTLTIMPRRAEMLSQNFPTARANAKGISRHMVKLQLNNVYNRIIPLLTLHLLYQIPVNKEQLLEITKYIANDGQHHQL